MASNLPKTMRAWTYSGRGAPRDVLKFNRSHPTPPPPTGSALVVRVSHTAVSPGGEFIMASIPSWTRPIPEIDFAGHVHAAGPDVPAPLAVGTAVFGTVPIVQMVLGRSGALAEYVKVSSDDVVPMPRGMPMAEAAGLNGNGQTALKLVRVAGLERVRGGKVLVNGASGGVGTLTVQVAKASGARRVVAICSGVNAEFVKSLGADEVVDYHEHQSLANYLGETHGLEPFDAVLDTINIQPLFEGSPSYLKSSGIYLTVGQYGSGLLWTFLYLFKNKLLPTLLGGTPRKFDFFSTIPEKQGAEELVTLVENSKLSVPIDRVLQMDNVLEGYDRIASRRARGKIIISVAEKKST